MPNFRLIRRIKLAFINERISEEDWEKYHFDGNPPIISHIQK